MNTPSRFIFCFLTLLIGVSISKIHAQTDSWAAAKNRKAGKLTVMYLEEDAFAYRDAKGLPTGVEIDIFRQFVNWVKHTKGVSLDVSYVAEPNFQKFYASVQNGPNSVVGLGTVTILERRKKEVQFTPPFINNIALLVTNSSAPDLVRLDQISKTFAGMKAIVAKGTTLEEYMLNLRSNYYPGLKIETVASQMDVVRKVAEDPTYFSYMDLSIYWPAFDKQGLPVKRHPAGDLSTETFGFITPVGSDWNEVLTEFFNLGSGYRATLAYKNILMKHLGVEVTKMLHITQQKTALAAVPQTPQ